MIGAAASIAWSGAGRVAGISGIVGGFLREPKARGFRPGFLLGLLLTSLLLVVVGGERLAGRHAESRSLLWLVVAGLLVGFGTRLGGGCTSGHGVCGISRSSARSLAATGVFMGVAALVVYVTRHVATGVLP